MVGDFVSSIMPVVIWHIYQREIHGRCKGHIVLSLVSKGNDFMVEDCVGSIMLVVIWHIY